MAKASSPGGHDAESWPLAPLIEEAKKWTPLAWWKLETRSFIVADTLLHVVLLVRGPVRPGGPQNEVDNIRQGLTETPQHVLDEIQDRRRSAIELLRSRDLIDAGAAARANAAPLGELGLTMAPELARHLPDAPAGAPPQA